MKIKLSTEDWEQCCKKQINNVDLEMPSEELVKKTEKIYNEIVLNLKQNKKNKTVISLYGGSGAGKTTISTLLDYIFDKNNIKSIVISGDNYPRRIPKANDDERLRIYRENGLRGLVLNKEYTEDRMQILKELLNQDLDFDPRLVESHKWLETYQMCGRKGLEKYLGTNNEIDFEEVSNLVADFKNGDNEIYIKSLGRNENEASYAKIDFSNIEIMILEWTHGNNENLIGVDYPIFLMSTPEETLEWRKKRNRDNGVGNPFTNQVLAIEQTKLNNQASNAKLIVNQKGEFLTVEDFNKMF